MPEPRESSLGGHAVLVVGYNKKTERFLVKNSWGPSWGQGGYFTLPFEYVPGYAFDAWTVRR
jgi:C1A family cysteine protease